MENPINITGYIKKEETVSSLNNNTLKNTFVIQVNHPFPGYYGQEMIDMTKPRSIIFITKNMESWERIIRLGNKINKYLDTSVNFSKAKIQLWNKTFYGIRAKGFKNYEEIYKVQRALQDEGIDFSKNRRMNNEEVGLITLKKFFNVKEVEPGIFLCDNRSDMAYVSIPHEVNWELFRRHTSSVKHNISDNSYDVVSGAFYFNYQMSDVLRIFKPGIKLELLKEIKERYEDVIMRFV